MALVTRLIGETDEVGRTDADTLLRSVTEVLGIAGAEGVAVSVGG